jgi:putative membrane protein (TIGR04086 family)
VLAAVRWKGVLLGIGVGILALAGLALVLWLILSAVGVDGAVGAATTFATVLTFPLAGWLAGRHAPFSPWFHGALAGMGIALLVVATAARSGSPSPAGTVLLLALMAIVGGAVGGHLGGYRTRNAAESGTRP